MKDLKFTDFSSFLDVVQSITKENLEKAKGLLKVNSVQLITKEDLAKAKDLLQTNGKSIESIEDIFVNYNEELFELLPNGSLVKVNLYISTQAVDKYSYNFNDIKVNALYKYHIYQCSTIATMFNSGRKHRYKINNRDDGTFYYTFTDFKGSILKINENQKVNICKNCLKKFLDIKFASDENVKNFKLKEFHNQNNNFFNNIDISSIEKGELAQANVYSRLWNKISRQVKTKKNYTCEKCGYIPKMAYEKKFIHTHHKNGDKQNNKEDNLQVLCIKCHSEVDSFHTRIKGLIDYKDYIKITE